MAMSDADMAELVELRRINTAIIDRYKAAGRTIQGFDPIYIRVMLEHLLGDELPNAQLKAERLWGAALDEIQVMAPLHGLTIARGALARGIT